MRLTLIVTTLALVAGLPAAATTSVLLAQAQECTGENCPPPGGQSGGRDCESKKKDQTVS